MRKTIGLLVMKTLMLLFLQATKDATTVNSEQTLPTGDTTTELSTVVGPLESV